MANAIQNSKETINDMSKWLNSRNIARINGTESEIMSTYKSSENDVKIEMTLIMKYFSDL